MMMSFKIEPLCDELNGLFKMVKVTHPESPSLTVDVNGQLCHSVAPSSWSCQQTLTGLRETCVASWRDSVFSASVLCIQTARQVAIASCAVRGARHRFLLLPFFFFGNSTAIIREMGKHSIYFGTESIYSGIICKRRAGLSDLSFMNFGKFSQAFPEAKTKRKLWMKSETVAYILELQSFPKCWDDFP